MDVYGLAKKTQKKKITAAELAVGGSLGALSIARAIKGCEEEKKD